MNRKIATRHRAQMYALIDAAEETAVLYLPQARAASASDADKVFGTSGHETGTSGTTVTVDVLPHQGKIPTDFEFQPAKGMIGMLSQSDVILSCKLDDVLVDSNKKYGRTQFDLAKTVELGGSKFKVKGTFRSGFAPLGPYILWIGLVNVGE